MIGKKWGHGHSMGVGAIVALLIATHFLWILTATLVVGILIGRSWHGLGKASGTVGQYAVGQARLADERWKEVRARRKAHIDKRRASREALARAHRAGVIEGMDYHR